MEPLRSQIPTGAKHAVSDANLKLHSIQQTIGNKRKRSTAITGTAVGVNGNGAGVGAGAGSSSTRTDVASISAQKSISKSPRQITSIVSDSSCSDSSDSEVQIQDNISPTKLFDSTISPRILQSPITYTPSNIPTWSNPIILYSTSHSEALFFPPNSTFATKKQSADNLLTVLRTCQSKNPRIGIWSILDHMDIETIFLHSNVKQLQLVKPPLITSEQPLPTQVSQLLRHIPNSTTTHPSVVVRLGNHLLLIIDSIHFYDMIMPYVRIGPVNNEILLTSIIQPCTNTVLFASNAIEPFHVNIDARTYVAEYIRQQCIRQSFALYTFGPSRFSMFFPTVECANVYSLITITNRVVFEWPLHTPFSIHTIVHYFSYHIQIKTTQQIFLTLELNSWNERKPSNIYISFGCFCF
jgi:hypothetical protein